MPAAVGLFERATDLLAADDSTRLRLLPSLGRARIESGDWEGARAVLSETVSAAAAAGERGAAADAAVALVYVELHMNPETSHAEVTPKIDAAVAVFEELGDKAGLARALSIAGMLRFWRGEMGRAIEELRLAARYAREAGDRPQLMDALSSMLLGLIYGPAPVAQAMEMIEDIRQQADGARRLVPAMLRATAHLEAMQGNFEPARDLLAEAEAVAEGLGLETTLAGGVLRSAGEIELLAGDAAAAERVLLRACATLERIGDLGHLGSVAPLLAEALLAQGRVEEAVEPIETAARWTLADDADAQINQLRARSMLAAHRGALDEAETLLRQALERASGTDDLNTRALMLADLADVLERSDRRQDAAGAVEQALALFEQKGNTVMAERLRGRLAESQQPAG
jgi:tetratricopeptide (TPR) repeat protein